MKKSVLVIVAVSLLIIAGVSLYFFTKSVNYDMKVQKEIEQLQQLQPDPVPAKNEGVKSPPIK